MTDPQPPPPAARDSIDFDALLTPPTEAEAVVAARRPLLWTGQVIAVTALLLLAFNAESPKSWADQLGDTPFSGIARTEADAWWTQATAWGLSAPRDAARRLWQSAVAARWKR